MKKDKKPYNPAAYPLFGIRLSPHPLQFIVMSHLRVQFVLHLFKEVGATVAFPAFDVRIEAVAVFGVPDAKSRCTRCEKLPPERGLQRLLMSFGRLLSFNNRDRV